MQLQFEEIIKKIKGMKVAVLGDAMLDVYIRGSSCKLAREAPVPVVDMKYEETAPGGAANTALNVATLGAECFFISVIGKDKEGEILLEKLKENKVNVKGVISDKNRKTLTKRRVFANSQTVMRLDSGSTRAVGEKNEKKMAEVLAEALSECQALIISDYDYGVITHSVIDCILPLNKFYPF